VSQYQKGKTNLDLLAQETVSGSGISWAMCKSVPRLRQITMPAPNHSLFYTPDALLAAEPTALVRTCQYNGIAFWLLLFRIMKIAIKLF